MKLKSGLSKAEVCWFTNRIKWKNMENGNSRTDMRKLVHLTIELLSNSY